MARPLYVARPMLPAMEEFISQIEGIWKSRILTNSGPLHQELEAELREYLGVPTGLLFNNATTALICALKMLDLPPGSEVVTTPMTFAATAHAITWNGLKPVFADVDPVTLTLCPASTEKAITDKTSAILAVHVYGTVCDVDALGEVANKHSLRLIFDSAHAFGAKIGDRSIGTFGDASVFSFHATKLFHTLEGGMITTPTPGDAPVIQKLRNFGITSEDDVEAVGINGKMNEMQAAMGLLNLRLVKDEREYRYRLRKKYEDFLRDLPGITLQPFQDGVLNSEQYFRISVDGALFGRTRDQLYQEMKAIGIYARKYFHPICTDFLPYRGLPIASVHDAPFVLKARNEVLCLPFHSGVEEEDLVDIKRIFLSGSAG